VDAVYSNRDASVRSTSVRYKRQVIRGAGGVAGREAHTVRPCKHYFPAAVHFVSRCLSSYVGNAQSKCICFSSTRKLVT
jgi:hypothetical protein